MVRAFLFGLIIGCVSLFAALWIVASRIAAIAHDPEKWEPVFGQDHAQEKYLQVKSCRLTSPIVPFVARLMPRAITMHCQAPGSPSISNRL